MRGLYPIIDVDVCQRLGLDPLGVARALLPLQPPLIQLRAKTSAPREVLSLLRALVLLAQGGPTRVFANDRPDLALMAGCAGVHLGQQDVPIEAVREIAPGLEVGLSTHTSEELRRALAQRPSYVAFGPVFATDTKADAEPCVGLEGLKRASVAARAAGIPLVAIGGITEAVLPEVARHAELASVISALLGPTLQDVTARARALTAALSDATR